MSTLITGACGFVGHQVVDYFLQNTKDDLVLMDSLTYAGNLNRITSLKSYDPKRVKFVYHNLRAPINDLVKRSLKDIEYIYHLAANSSVEFTLVNPEITVMDNVMATVNILEYARNCESLIKMNMFSTDEVLGPVNRPGNGLPENAPHNPSNPYSAGKAAAECYTTAWHVTYGVPTYITRCMNIYGYDQHPEKYIPTVIRHLDNGTVLPVYSSANGKVAGSRFWIFAYDVADALLFLQKHGNAGGIYHIVGDWCDNLDLAQKIAKITGKELHYKMFDFHSSRPGHDLHYGLQDNHMRKMGWKLKYGLDKGLEMIVPTYRSR